MRKNFIFMLVTLCMMAFVSCDDSEEKTWNVPKLNPNNTDFTFSADGGSRTVTVTNYDAWTIKNIHYENASGKDIVETPDDPRSMSGGWFDAKVIENGGKYNTLQLTVYKNTGDKRDKYVSMTCGDMGVAIHVIQEAASSGE